MIGYYVHHVGQGHLQRARCIVAELQDEVTVLSSLPSPDDWPGKWVELPRDDSGGQLGDVVDVTAGGFLHWVPPRHAGLRDRAAAVAGWISAADPDVLVSDVSVEVGLLARLCGVPLVMVALPGRRDDAPHQLAFGVADAILAPWPDLAPSISVGLERHQHKTSYVGGISRFDGRMVDRRQRGAVDGIRVLCLRGAGGGQDPMPVPRLPRGWGWTERGPSCWTDDPWLDLCGTDVVVAHCGLGAVSDVAAVRRPAVLLPEPRPFGEQHATAQALHRCGVAIVLEQLPDDWAQPLQAALDLGADSWRMWSDGNGAQRAARLIESIAVRP